MLSTEVKHWVHDAATQHCIQTGERGTIACLSMRSAAQFREATGCTDWVLDTTGVINLHVDSTLGDHEITILSTTEVNTGNQQQAVFARYGA